MEIKSVHRKLEWTQYLIVGLISIAISIIIAISDSPKIAFFIIIFPIIFVLLIASFIWFEKTALTVLFLLPLIPPAFGVEISSNLPLITWQRILMGGLWFVLLFRAKEHFLFLNKSNRNIILLLALIILSNIVSSFFTTSFLSSLYRVLAISFDGIGLVLLLLFISHNNSLFAKKILMVLFLSLAVLGLFGILDFFFGFNVLSWFPGARDYTFETVTRLGLRRGQGLLPQPMALSFATAIGGVLGLALLNSNNNHRFSFFTGLMLSVILIASVITFTRTGWFALFAGIIVWLITARKNLSPKIHVIIIFSLVIGVLASAFSFSDRIMLILQSGFILTTQNEVSTLLSRISWFSVIWSVTSHDPVRILFGFGPGSSELVWESLRTFDLRGTFTNNFLILFIESGLLGLICMIALFLETIRLSILASSKDKINTFYLSGVFMIFLSLLTTPIFVWSQTNYIFWTIVSCIIISSQKQINNRNKYVKK